MLAVSHPTVFSTPVSTIPTSTKTWLTAFTADTLKIGVPERANELDKNLGKVVELKNFLLLQDKVRSYIDWDFGKVSQVGKDPLLYSTGFMSCIAVLALGFKSHEKKPSYTALHHVFINPDNLKGTLKELADKVKKGTVQLFITAGYQQYIADWHKVYQIINLMKNDHSEIDFDVVADSFAICDIGRPDYVNFLRFEIAEAGFDEQYRPFQIVGVSEMEEKLDFAFADRWV